MSITDELREYALGWDERNRVRRDLTAIADRIDAEHEQQLVEARAEGMQEGFAADKGPRGFVELPKDADGEYINVGDRLDGYGKTIEVVELRYGRSGWVLISRDGNGYADTFAFTHHAPTVEDVLRDVVTLCHNTWKEGSAFEFYDVDDVMKSGNIAEFAAKLRLAEEEDA